MFAKVNVYTTSQFKANMMKILVILIDLSMVAVWTWVEIAILVLVTQSNLLQIFTENTPSVWQMFLFAHNLLVYGLIRYRFSRRTFGEWICDLSILS